MISQPNSARKYPHETSSRAIDTERSLNKAGSHINELYNKFMDLNKQVSIEFDSSGFNLAEFQHEDSKIQYDNQMVQAKLKRLQNNFQLKKANQELQNRRKRPTKKKYTNTMNQQDSYLNIYKKYASTVSKKVFKGQNQSESDQELKKVEEQPIKGINHYYQLRKHPKFLQFTIDKMKQKQLHEIETKNQRIQAFQKLKKNIKQITHRGTHSKRTLEGDFNPQQLADNIFRKLYTKKNKEPPIEEAKTDRRVAKIIDKQEQILDTLDERSLSKQSYKKLKGRMNEIANQLYLVDKKHSNKLFFPKLRLNKSTIQYEEVSPRHIIS